MSEKRSNHFDGKPYAVVICDQQTGYRRRCEMGGIVWNESGPYWWTDGNFGCDCNLGATFAEGKPVNRRDYDCCGNARYTIEAFIFDPGTPEEFVASPESLDIPTAIPSVISDLRSRLADAEREMDEARAMRVRWVQAMLKHYPIDWEFDPNNPELCINNVVEPLLADNRLLAEECVKMRTCFHFVDCKFCGPPHPDINVDCGDCDGFGRSPPECMKTDPEQCLRQAEEACKATDASGALTRSLPPQP